MPVLTARDLLSWICWRKLPQNKFPQNLTTPVFILLFSSCRTNKKKRGWRRDAHSIACSGRGAIQRRLGSKEVVWLRLLLEAEPLFKLFFPSAINYYDFNHLEMFLKCVSPNHLQHLLSAHVTSGWHEKILVEFFKIIYRQKHCFLGRFFDPGSMFFTWHLVVNFWNFAALRQPLPNNGWIPLASVTTKFPFSAKLCLKLG